MRLMMTRKQPARECTHWLFVHVAIHMAMAIGNQSISGSLFLARALSVRVACACMQVYADFWVFVFAVYVFGAVVCSVFNYWLAQVIWGS